MPRTATDIVNEAIFMMGDKVTPVTGTAPAFDDSTAGIASRYLYTPTVQAVARSYEWDFARRSVSLGAVTGNTPPMGFAFEYLYPTNGIEVWQVMAPTVVDPFDPLPTNWVVGNTLVADVQKKVIWADVLNAVAIYNNQPTEDLWDPGFVDAVVRRLASLYSMALAGRPETGDLIARSSLLALQLATSRDA